MSSSGLSLISCALLRGAGKGAANCSRRAAAATVLTASHPRQGHLPTLRPALRPLSSSRANPDPGQGLLLSDACVAKLKELSGEGDTRTALRITVGVNRGKCFDPHFEIRFYSPFRLRAAVAPASSTSSTLRTSPRTRRQRKSENLAQFQT